MSDTDDWLKVCAKRDARKRHGEDEARTAAWIEQDAVASDSVTQTPRRAQSGADLEAKAKNRNAAILRARRLALARRRERED